MNSARFDPSAVAVKNGRFFGLPYTPEEAEIVLLQAPWDVTTSYRDGTNKGPSALLEASYQLDFFSPYRARAWETRIASLPLNKKWAALNKKLRSTAKKHIALLESGKKPSKEAENRLRRINQESAKFHAALEAEARKWIRKGRAVVTVGGDHSVSYGPVKALSEEKGFSILHIDAHADLRYAYEGFPHSHASIMRLLTGLPGVRSVTQVGLRDVSPDEMQVIEGNKNIHSFFDWDMKRARAEGVSWRDICDRIVESLDENVYVSFDIDGLDPRYCPSTGTPVPGGLELDEVFYLFERTVKSGRKIIGADLVEVAPSGETGDEWDANVGARVLFQLCQFIKNSL